MSFQDLRVLAISDETVAAATKVRAYAIEHRETMKQLTDRIQTNASGPANDPNHHLSVPEGYHIIYTIEQQPVGWCQHFCISHDKPGVSPNINAVCLILEHCFGVRWNTRPKVPNPSKPDIAIDAYPDPRMRGVEHLLFPFKFTKPAVEGAPGAP